MNEKLTKLLQDRKDCKEIEKETKPSFLTGDQVQQQRFYIAKKLRKKTEKAIFKILEDGKECKHDFHSCGTRAVKCLKCNRIFETEINTLND